MEQPTNASPFMTVAEVAAFLRQCEDTIQRLCRSGELPAKRLGRSWIINRAALEQRYGVAPKQQQYLRAVE